MKRRLFLGSSFAAAGLSGSAAIQSLQAAEGVGKAPSREYYELRVYTLKTAKQPMLDEYLSKAFIPALGRMEIGPVGVFSEAAGPEHVAVYVLIVYQTCDQFALLSSRLAADPEHTKAAADYLAAPASDPVYERIESSIMRATAGMPKMVKPDAAKPRVMNLRIYESHNERAALKKIEMFDTGELAVFQRAEMPVVFCSQTIIGSKMPNLTYMLVFPDDAGRAAGWKRFGKNDPVWQKFRSMHEYDDKEIVSKITNKVLTPAAYSQL